MSAFPEISKIPYEGPESKNPLAFRWYNPDEVVEGKTMRDHMRLSVVYWHTFRGDGSDPFGAPTMYRPWEDGTDSVENAKNRVRVAFEFIEKLNVYEQYVPDAKPWTVDADTRALADVCLLLLNSNEFIYVY